MIIYRSAGDPVDPACELRALTNRAAGLPRSPSHDTLVDLFIEAAELEAAVADAIFPAADAVSPTTDYLSALTAAAARAVVRSWQGDDPAPAVRQFLETVDGVTAAPLPPAATRRVSEGYAYYALHPETYAAAALSFARCVRPRDAVCIGIRTAGAGLAAIVAAALETAGVQAATYSVRPRGHPFDRVLAVADPLRDTLVRHGDAHYLVTDEGPGISGTSFASVVSWLTNAGVPAARIHLFPSWNAAASALQSSDARRIWDRHRKWHVAAADAGAGLSRVLAGATATNYSAGLWRDACYRSASEWPPVMAAHERVKALLPAESTIVRFAGLGRYGRARYARAAALADANLGVAPGVINSGYLALAFEPGRPCVPADADETLVRHAARHIAFLQRAFPAPRSPGVEGLLEMVELNIREADASISLAMMPEWAASIGSAPATAVDGRMQAHEWIRTAGGFLKVDALDHSADHFFPGTQDSAWDLAAFEAEFGVDGPLSALLVDLFCELTGDRDVRFRLPFYRLAYAAFQVGYSTFACQSLGESADARRFARRRELFRGRLPALAARPSSQ